MPWEDIGSVDTGSVPNDAGWIDWAQHFALSYIKLVCGDPPSGCDLDIVSVDHELGSYPTLGVYYDFGGPPDGYIRRCEEALDVFNRAIDWGKLGAHFESTVLLDEEYVSDCDDDNREGPDSSDAEADIFVTGGRTGDDVPASRADATVFTEMGCTACWAADAAAAWQAFQSTSIRHYLIDEPHFIVSIRQCPTCGQQYLQVTTEMIDWQNGEDPVHRVVMPIDDVECQSLVAATPLPNQALERIGAARRALNYDWPAGSEPTIYWAAGMRVRSHD
ncbi:MAG TPA: hypothetical protein VF284_12640 [Rhodanobacteraceae bacterium]